VNSFQLDAYGFPKSTGIFETIKTVAGQPVALERHMRRALISSRELGFSIPGEEEIREAVARAIKELPHAIGRLRLFFGKQFFSISHLDYQEINAPARLTLYSRSVEGLIHKQFPYDFRYSLLESAHAEGFDDTILFNRKNEVTESAVSNILFRIDGKWVTPPISAGILPGVIRAISIERCGVRVRSIHVTEIADVQSAFLISSLRVAQPISHIGDMELEIGQPSQLLEAEIRANYQPVSLG
jgi:branched-subunit amino acid aminotransferase/4-amino-4-deoxychorismate lyase